MDRCFYPGCKSLYDIIKKGIPYCYEHYPGTLLKESEGVVRQYTDGAINIGELVTKLVALWAREEGIE